MHAPMLLITKAATKAGTEQAMLDMAVMAKAGYAMLHYCMIIY